MSETSSRARRIVVACVTHPHRDAFMALLAGLLVLVAVLLISGDPLVAVVAAVVAAGGTGWRLRAEAREQSVEDAARQNPGSCER